MNRRDLLKAGILVAVAPASLLAKESTDRQNTFHFVGPRNLRSVSVTNFPKVEIDIKGDGTDLMSVPIFPCNNLQREYKKFMEGVRKGGIMPCNIWIIDYPDNKRCSMAAMSKKLFPHARLLVEGHVLPITKTLHRETDDTRIRLSDFGW